MEQQRPPDVYHFPGDGLRHVRPYVSSEVTTTAATTTATTATTTATTATTAAATIHPPLV